MADLSTIREGLRVRLATISGLRTYATWPDQIIPPAAIVMPEDGAERETIGGDHFRLPFTVILLVAPAQQSFERGQENLDGYLDTTGAASIIAAIHGDRTLAGNVDTLYCQPATAYDTYEDNGVDFIGARFRVDVWT